MRTAISRPTDEAMAQILVNSFKDFHVKGFDYICLSRRPERTDKLYFFNGDLSRAPEVVFPHDHRYDFDTYVISGSVINTKYKLVRSSDPTSLRFEEFYYRTPLNGGSGFSWRSAAFLGHHSTIGYGSGESYPMAAQEFHTIKIHGPDTVLLLTQFEDVVPLDEPTRCFTRDREPPSLSGLYSKFTADEVLERLRRVYDLVLP